MSSRRQPHRTHTKPAPGAFRLPDLRQKSDTEIVNLATELSEIVMLSNNPDPADNVSAIAKAKLFRERWGVTDLNKVRKQVSSEYARRQDRANHTQREMDIQEAITDIEFARRPWTPFNRADVPSFDEADPKAIADIERIVEHFKVTREEAIAQYREVEADDIFINSKYQVNIRRGPCTVDGIGETEMVHISIKRIDKRPVRDWRDLQRIKDELLGRNCEAVEVFPAQDRMVDTANQYHLWGIANEDFRFPFGFEQRFVADAPENPEEHSMQQRPLDGAHGSDESLTTYETPAEERD